MSGWRNRVDDLLYSGESVVESVDFDSVGIVITSHRVLTFDPESDGATFQQVDRPNVEGVSMGAQSDSGLLERGVRTLLVGVVLVGAGLVVDFGSLVGGVDLGGQSTQELGMGGIMGTLQRLLGLISQLDYLMRVFGALALFLGVVFLGVYWFTRDRTLVVEVAGGDNIHVPRPSENAGDYAERLEQLVAPGSPVEKSGTETAQNPLGES
ncbi:hypothetical protein [Salinibaculum salinum]|uniref:hypothetical protein n=1 Tax=Salinibaculum salinum TaxID=3131996 RepID=UPI0030EF6DA9